MNILIKVNKIFFTGLIFFFNLSPAFSSQVLKSFNTTIQIRTQEDRFYTRQPVWVTVCIENKGTNGPGLVNVPLDKQFIMEDSQGNRLPVNVDRGESGSSRRMRSGEIIENKVNVIRTFYLLGKRDPYLPSDEYTVIFHWEEEGYRCLSSNKISIVVTDPKGDEFKALNLLNNGDRHYRLKQLEKSDECYLKLVEKYPESMYAANGLELIFRNHLNRYDGEHQAIRIKTAKRLLEEYPEGHYHMSWIFFELEDDYRRQNNLKGLGDYMEFLRNKTPSSEIKSMAEKVLRRIENNIGIQK